MSHDRGGLDATRLESLERLTSLRQSGALSSDEFERAKSALLDPQATSTNERPFAPLAKHGSKRATRSRMSGPWPVVLGLGGLVVAGAVTMVAVRLGGGETPPAQSNLPSLASRASATVQADTAVAPASTVASSISTDDSEPIRTETVSPSAGPAVRESVESVAARIAERLPYPYNENSGIGAAVSAGQSLGINSVSIDTAPPRLAFVSTDRSIRCEVEAGSGPSILCAQTNGLAVRCDAERGCRPVNDPPFADVTAPILATDGGRVLNFGDEVVCLVRAMVACETIYGRTGFALTKSYLAGTNQPDVTRSAQQFRVEAPLRQRRPVGGTYP